MERLSRKYNTVKNYYDRGLWSISRVGDAVTKGWITAEEY
ncbi:MAG: XkdX family protein, partial [Clostridiales bacterium]|nr:XkdX family protein [Clostridiales bacterium]